MRVHFIAIGGSAMHNLALELKFRGFEVRGSDDAIYEPSRTRLENAGILPERIGWFPEQISAAIDYIILGMHAKADNPELKRAQDLNLKIYSYPEFFFSQNQNQKRLVIAGSHGKTTITSMVLHALNAAGKKCNYLVGAQLQGFDRMVCIDPQAEISVIEGDEYLSSPIDRRSKFLWYKPDAAVISGIAWDHINVFPTFLSYLNTFKAFIESINPGGSLAYYQNDEHLPDLVQDVSNIQIESYKTHDYNVDNEGNWNILFGDLQVPLKIIGKHNMQNLMAAMFLVNAAGVPKEDFFEYMKSFAGADRRLEEIEKNSRIAAYKDFAHSPSKVLASVEAMRETYPKRKLIACVELHTFSSLNPDFLKEYKGCLDKADKAIVYADDAVLKKKGATSFGEAEILSGFGNKQVTFTRNIEQTTSEIENAISSPSAVIIMSSGNFGGLNVSTYLQKIASK